MPRSDSLAVTVPEIGGQIKLGDLPLEIFAGPCFLAPITSAPSAESTPTQKNKHGAFSRGRKGSAHYHPTTTPHTPAYLLIMIFIGFWAAKPLGGKIAHSHASHHRRPGTQKRDEFKKRKLVKAEAKKKSLRNARIRPPNQIPIPNYQISTMLVQPRTRASGFLRKDRQACSISVSHRELDPGLELCFHM